MAKRLECVHCQSVVTKKVTTEVVNQGSKEEPKMVAVSVTYEYTHFPVFRGKRQLGRHIQQTHPDYQQEANQLLREAREAVKANRKGRR